MQTRLSRHDYEDEILDVDKRTRKNTSLYKQDYNDEDIIVPYVSNGRELDKNEFEKIINESKTRTMKVITKEDCTQDIPLRKEEKIYDINSVLEKAKNRRVSSSQNSRYKVPEFTEYIPKKDTLDEVDEDIDLLSDLRGNDNTIVTPKISDSTLIDVSNDTSDIDDFKNDNTETKIDDSFYSKSIKFQRKDFDEDTYKQKKSKCSKSQIIITILIVLLLVVAVVFGIIILSKVKF